MPSTLQLCRRKQILTTMTSSSKLCISLLAALKAAGGSSEVAPLHACENLQNKRCVRSAGWQLSTQTPAHSLYAWGMPLQNNIEARRSKGSKRSRVAATSASKNRYQVSVREDLTAFYDHSKPQTNPSHESLSSPRPNHECNPLKSLKPNP